MLSQGIQTCVPQLTVRPKPIIESDQLGGTQRIHSLLGFLAHLDHARIARQLPVLRRARLSQPEPLHQCQLARYNFTNDSPVVWAFYDSVRTGEVPASSRMHYKLKGTVALFRQFAIAEHIAHSAWIVSPGETVWLESLENVSFGIATPLISSSWLLYRQQSSKISELGKSYAKRIATMGSKSRTRTFPVELRRGGHHHEEHTEGGQRSASDHVRVQLVVDREVRRPMD